MFQPWYTCNVQSAKIKLPLSALQCNQIVPGLNLNATMTLIIRNTASCCLSDACFFVLHHDCCGDRG